MKPSVSESQILGCASRPPLLHIAMLFLVLASAAVARDLSNNDAYIAPGQYSEMPSQNKKRAAIGCALLTLVGGAAYAGIERLKTAVKFAYNCFFKPLGLHTNQQGRLDAFYEGQADVYDATRGGLLRGRTTMLKLVAAELRSRVQNGSKPIWIDVGGGTGWNIEQMDKYFGIKQFERVYLIDLCRPLCKVAEDRFRERGWTNVTVLCQDAATFELPGLADDIGKIDLITMSYSLSMIESFNPVVDRLSTLLKPAVGLLGVVDFYVSGASGPSAQSETAGILNYQCNWFTRVFWQHWFEFDHVYLHPCRRNYLEHKFDTHKVLNARNHFVVPYLIQMPYYAAHVSAIGSNVLYDTACGHIGNIGSNTDNRTGHGVHGANTAPSNHQRLSAITRVDSGYLTPGNSPKQLPTTDVTDTPASVMAPEILGVPAIASSASNKHTHGWVRMPYTPSKPEHAQFATYIYGFTWEDPRRDVEVLELTANDNVMAHQPGLRIQCIDMNPCQNHLLELKLAALRTLDYDEFWQMFGCGLKSDFVDILDCKLSAHLSSSAYQFWRGNADTFAPKSSPALEMLLGDLAHRNLYTTGWLGVHKYTQSLVVAKSLAEQRETWLDKVRGRILSTLAIRIMDNPVAMWQLLGVPINQWNMLRSEGSMGQYMADTIDPVATSTSFVNDNYFYHLLFSRSYSEQCRPDYLTPDGFRTLKQAANDTHTTFTLHTSTILDVLRKVQPGELTKAVIMDHMDWFTEKDADEEVIALARAVRTGGFVLWRSAARVPWYIEVFRKHGFAVEALSIRKPGSLVPIDRVNMYASFYKATKL
ncbi:hypothetical protein DL89DRAFT_265542 [Linderina pennispora]|uniref:Methyltransferase domain-containing protein n=1 Tax=Linderina pennispora TaxID=61395 RepID=A0A1Y1WE80_9FUNG|nr:uncharacterized protein DL89DRAFT_265542 [Linderina pennispora]ORX71830.1 hypothetical protein DL89DRAFT_265542 [Linderina pennispora]